MALQYVDGFAHQNAARYLGTPTGMTWNTTSGRVQPYSVTTLNCARSITAAAEVFTGFGVKTSNWAAFQWASFWGDSGVTQHITLTMNATTGLLEVRRGATGGTLLATGTTAISLNTWYYVEVHVTVADSGGVVQVRLNGSTSNEIAFTGDTKNAGTSTNIDTVKLTAGNSSLTITDWYVCDATGSVNNTWLGDTVVRTLVPTGDGDSSGLVGSDGNSVANWQNVDELPASSVDYNAGSTSGVEDTYALADLPAGVGTVRAVQVCATMLKSDAGTSTTNLITRVAGTDYAGATRTLSTSATEVQELRETNPGTSAGWTVSDVNALQVGMKVA